MSETVSKLKLFAKIGEPYVIQGLSEGLEVWEKLRFGAKKFKKSVDINRNIVIIWRIK